MRLMNSLSLVFPGGDTPEWLLPLRSIHLQGARAGGVLETSLLSFGVLAVTVDEEIKLAKMMLSSSVTFGATFSAGEGFGVLKPLISRNIS